MKISFAQTETAIVSDTLKKEIIAISPTDIPNRSAGIITLLQDISKEVVTKEEIENNKLSNSSLLYEIDSVVKEEDGVVFEDQTTRYLSNRVVFWKTYTKKLQSEIDILSKELEIIERYNQKVVDDRKVWNKTKKELVANDPGSGILPRVDKIIFALDSVNKELNNKSNEILVQLNGNTEKGLIIQNRIAMLDNIFTEKRKLIFVKNEPSLFSVEYRNRSKTDLIEPLHEFYNSEVKPALVYMEERPGRVIINLSLLFLLIFFFSNVAKRLDNVDINYQSVYRKYMVKILSRSVSAAVVLAVFSMWLIYKDRPEFIRDVSVLVMMTPIILITRTFTNARYYRYLTIFGIVILLNTTYIIFPPDNMYYMFFMLLTGILEIYILWSIIRYLLKSPLLSKSLNFIVLTSLFVLLGFAVAGTVGLLYGSTTLAEVALNVPIFTTYSGLLIFILVIIINGIISFIIDTKNANKLNFVKFHGHIIKKRLITLVNLVFAIIWIQSILQLINLYRPLIKGIEDFLDYDLKVGSVIIQVGDIFLFFLVIYISIIISNVIKILLEKDVLDKLNLVKGLPHTIAMMAKYTIITLGVLLAISAVGIPMSNIAVVAGAMGVGIGFGLQNIFNNIVSGFILLFERPIQIGDTIEVGTLIGTVKSIGVRASNIKTFDGADIIVPNGDIVSNQVVNWTLSDKKRRVEVLAGVAYGSDPHKVKKLFEDVLHAHKDIIGDPAPVVYFQGLGESSLDFRLLFWTSNFDNWLQLRSEIIFNVHDILYKEGITIPFPQMDLHLKSVEAPVEIAKNESNTKVEKRDIGKKISK